MTCIGRRLIVPARLAAGWRIAQPWRDESELAGSTQQRGKWPAPTPFADRAEGGASPARRLAPPVIRRPRMESETDVLSVSWDTVRLFLHVLAATIWVGGQLVLAALVPVLRRFGSEAVTAVARRFNQVAWGAFAVLVLTGIWNIEAISGTADDTASYRTTLMVKLAVVVLSGV